MSWEWQSLSLIRPQWGFLTWVHTIHTLLQLYCKDWRCERGFSLQRMKETTRRTVCACSSPRRFIGYSNLWWSWKNLERLPPRRSEVSTPADGKKESREDSPSMAGTTDFLPLRRLWWLFNRFYTRACTLGNLLALFHSFAREFPTDLAGGGAGGESIFSLRLFRRVLEERERPTPRLHSLVKE